MAGQMITGPGHSYVPLGSPTLMGTPVRYSISPLPYLFTWIITQRSSKYHFWSLVWLGSGWIRIKGLPPLERTLYPYATESVGYKYIVYMFWKCEGKKSKKVQYQVNLVSSSAQWCKLEPSLYQFILRLIQISPNTTQISILDKYQWNLLNLEWPLRSHFIQWKICIFTMLAFIPNFKQKFDFKQKKLQMLYVRT